MVLEVFALIFILQTGSIITFFAESIGFVIVLPTMVFAFDFKAIIAAPIRIVAKIIFFILNFLLSPKSAVRRPKFR